LSRTEALADAYCRNAVHGLVADNKSHRPGAIAFSEPVVRQLAKKAVYQSLRFHVSCLNFNFHRITDRIAR
jgi:hypothetical protein